MIWQEMSYNRFYSKNRNYEYEPDISYTDYVDDDDEDYSYDIDSEE